VETITSSDLRNRTLEAQWTAKTDTKYTIVYKLEDLDINGVYNETGREERE
jgi:hypothetical protein